MILLDTNVISALMQHEPDPVVVAWLDSQPAISIWTTAVTVFEIRFGLAILPSGRRKRALEEAFATVLEDDFERRIVPFDDAAAQFAARIAAERRRVGRTIEIRDVQIAGIAAAQKATIATRNVRHFEGLGLDVIDPWAIGR